MENTLTQYKVLDRDRLGDHKMNILMIGVDKGRNGGMWTVAEMFLSDPYYNSKVNLRYIPTSTGGSVPKRLLKMITGYIKILVTLFFCDVDILHIHMAEKGSTFRKGMIVKIGKFFKKKVVVQMHAGPFMNWYKQLSNKKQRTIQGYFGKADVVIALGEYWKKQLESIVDINKLRVVYNGSFCPEKREYNSNGNYIMFLGMLRKEKGIYDLIYAISIINSKLNDEIKILLCGEDVAGDIQKTIDEKDLNKRIKMLGWISKEKRDELFKNTQLCVLPTYAEALSMTVIESMCHGIPIITTNITTMPELVGNHIKLVEPGNVNQLAETILQYTENEEKRVQASVELFDRAKNKFSNKRCVSDVLKIYDDLMS